MRKFVQWAACLAAMLLMLGACADGPTGPDQQPRAADLARMEASQDQQLAGCVRDGTCVLPPITITVPGCDPWMSLDWCESDGGNCITSVPGSGEHQGVMGCPDPGGGGSPGTPSPPKVPGSGPALCPTAATGTCPEPEPQPADTCKTGDPVVDDPKIWGSFQSLWDVSIQTGTERGGWIVKDGSNSYRLVPFVSGGCKSDTSGG